jgi:hypothetical protein
MPLTGKMRENQGHPIKHAEFSAIGQKCPDATQIVRVHVDEQLLADEVCTCRQHAVGIARPMQIDVGSHALVEIRPNATPPRRLHQAKGATLMLGQPRYQRLPAAHEIPDRFQRRDVVQASMWRAVVTRDGISTSSSSSSNETYKRRLPLGSLSALRRSRGWDPV